MSDLLRDSLLRRKLAGGKTVAGYAFNSNEVAAGAAEDVFAEWLESDEAAMVLVSHQRRDIKSCICGWAELGQMHPRHVLDKLAELVRE